MNRIYRLVFNKHLNALVVASEFAKASKGGRTRKHAFGATARVLAPLSLLGALLFASPAWSQSLPAGAILDINNGTAPNSAAYTTPNQFQNYSVTFTAANDGNNYLLFAFRQDPAYWTFGNVSLVASGSTTNLLQDPTFTQGGSLSEQSGLQAPAQWGIVYQTGTTPRAAGHWVAPGDAQYSTDNINQGDAGSWYDGAVGSFDGIYQGVDLVGGITYTINFSALSNNAATTDGRIELGVFVGPCISLSGDPADCVPNNPDFTVLATPSQTENAGGPTSTPIADPVTTTDLGTLDGAFDGGTLVTDSDTTLDQDFTISDNGGTIDQSGHDVTLTGTISDATDGEPGSLTIINSGDGGGVTLTGTNTYTGTTTIDDNATLALDGNGSIADSTGVTDNGTFDISGASADASITTLNGNGTVDLGGNNLNLTDASSAFGGTIEGTGGLVLTGGVEVLTGTNTYAGGTTIDNATLQVGSDANLGDASGSITFDEGTLHTTGNLDSNRDIILAGDGAIDTGTGTTMTDGGDVSGTGALIKDGQGTLELDGTLSHGGGTIVNDGTLVLTGGNSYTGGTTVNDGTLQIGNDANLGDASGNLTLDGGTLHITDNVDTSRDISLEGDGTIDTDAGTTTTDGGDVNGAGALVKDGQGTLELDGTLSHSGGTIVNDGTLTLTGSNSYTGGTTVNGGTLEIGNDANLGDASGNLTLDGGTLHITDNVDTSRDISLEGDGIIDTDTGATMADGGDVSGSGTLVKDGVGEADFGGVLSHTGGTVVDDGTLVLSGNNTYTGGTTLNGGTLQIESGANLGAASSGLTFDGGTLHATGSFSTSRQITLAGEGQFDVDTGTTLTATDAIDGNGRLVKQGEGTLVLTGANTYTGGTTLDAGTLQGNSTSLHGDIVDNGTLEFVQAGNGTFGGAISGSGGLVKDGNGNLTISGVASHQGGTTVNAGVLILNGNNTYTGGTTINGGSLQIGSDANLGDTSSDLRLNGGTLHTTGSFESDRDIALGGGSFSTDAGSTFTSDGAIAGTGGLVKNGQGTMVVDGVASHQGGTTVNAGVLILNGNNTYTGGTTLNGGSLHIGGDANLGDASSTITFNGGDLTVTQSMASDRDMVIKAGNASITTLAGVTFSAHGDMSGTGGLVKRGDGTLVVSGNNTFTGGTLIDGGVIKIDSGSSLGTGTILLHGGTLQTVQTLGTGQTVLVSGNSGVNVDAGKIAELSGQILTDGDAGCFVKSGKGTLNMTGNATLSDGTCVQDGMLRANGELASQVQVDRPGTLRGIGHISGSVNVEGTLAAGNSPGTLAVNGAVTMHAGSTLQVDIDGHGTGTGEGNYSRLLVGGRFTAAGTLAPILRGITGNASNAFVPAVGDLYTVVQAAGGVSGTFDALQQPTAGLADNTRFQVFYVDGKAVELFVTPASYATLVADHANGNAAHAGDAVDRMVATQDAGGQSDGQRDLLFALAGLRAAVLPQVMQNLAGEAHAQTAAMAREASFGLAGDMADHLAEASLDQGEHGSRAWATLSQGGYRALSDAQATGFHSQQSRASAGLDAYRGDAATVGVGLAHTEAWLEDVPASGNVRGNGVMLYGQMAAGKALLDGTASWSKDTWSTRRADPLAPASSLSSETDGHSMAASVTARFPSQHEGVRIEPYVQALWQRVDRDGFAEAGDALTALTVGRYEQTGTRLLAGMNLGSAAQDPLATSATWRVGAAVGQDFGDTLNPVVDATLGGESFSVRAPSMGRTLLKLDASGTLRVGKQAYLYGGLNSATGHDRASYGVNVGVRVQF